MRHQAIAEGEMWQQFTERTRRSIVMAQEEAVERGNSQVGNEHLLCTTGARGSTVPR